MQKQIPRPNAAPSRFEQRISYRLSTYSQISRHKGISAKIPTTDDRWYYLRLRANSRSIPRSPRGARKQIICTRTIPSPPTPLLAVHDDQETDQREDSPKEREPEPEHEAQKSHADADKNEHLADSADRV